jgi:hypothetical protein
MASPRRISVAKHPGVHWHPVAGGRRYEISYVDSDGKRRWESVPGGLKDAEAAREDKRGRMRKNERGRADQRRRSRRSPPSGSPRRQELRPRTVERYELALRVHIVKRVGRVVADRGDAEAGSRRLDHPRSADAAVADVPGGTELRICRLLRVQYRPFRSLTGRGTHPSKCQVR